MTFSLLVFFTWSHPHNHSVGRKKTAWVWCRSSRTFDAAVEAVGVKQKQQKQQEREWGWVGLYKSCLLSLADPGQARADFVKVIFFARPIFLFRSFCQKLGQKRNFFLMTEKRKTVVNYPFLPSKAQILRNVLSQGT